jgi:3-dehydroquinate dehydratase/shikimate dehydrogenase
MICISVTPESLLLAKADLLNASRHCDLIELCLDHLGEPPDPADLVSAVDKPIIVSCRRVQDGGQWRGSEEERLALLQQSVKARPAYVEIELDVADQIPVVEGTKRVISYTSLDEPIRDVEAVLAQARQTNADVVKFTWPTPTLHATWPLVSAVTRKRDMPVVGMGLGNASLMFSLLGRKYGSPWVYAALEKGMEAHEGQPTVFELDEIYDWNHIVPSTHFVGLFGFGPAETLVVRMLNGGFKTLGINTRCLPLRLGSTDRLDMMLERLRMNALLISPHCGDQMREFADRSEAASTESRYSDVIVETSDGWTAYNILWRIATRAIEEALGKTGPGHHPLNGRDVLIVGANSTAQAIAYGIYRRRGRLSVTAPTDAQAEPFVAAFDCPYVSYDQLHTAAPEVIIFADSSIPIGRGRRAFDLSLLKEPVTVLDLSRMPRESAFSQEARQRGCRVVDPRDVFVNVVAAQFTVITGDVLPDNALQQALAAEA